MIFFFFILFPRASIDCWIHPKFGTLNRTYCINPGKHFKFIIFFNQNFKQIQNMQHSKKSGKQSAVNPRIPAGPEWVWVAERTTLASL